MNKLKDLSSNEVEKLNDSNAIIIDVRREDEWKHTGVIANSNLLTFFDMFGNCDIVSWLKGLENITKSKDKLIILVCAHANRTRTIGDFLIEKQAYTNIAHLEGGIAAWIQNGKNLESYIK